MTRGTLEMLNEERGDGTGIVSVRSRFLELRTGRQIKNHGLSGDFEHQIRAMNKNMKALRNFRSL
jgi:hypothetical protein